jgi:hypothetical protein
MGFESACLFNKKPADMRRVGAVGGRARARNLRLRKPCQVLASREISWPREETTAEAIRCIDVLFPWLLGVERREARRR